jgi:hypothetical protein
MKELFCIAAAAADDDDDDDDDDYYATAVSPHQRLQIMQRLPFCVGQLKDYANVPMGNDFFRNYHTNLIVRIN